MDLKHSRSIESENMYKHVIGIPLTSSKYAFQYKSSQKASLPDPAVQNQLLPSPNHYSKIRHGRVDSIVTRMIKLGESMDITAQGIREHVKLGPKLSEMVKGKLSLAAKILQVGGVDKVFKHSFNIRDDEKLLKASQCYLSTTAGPIAGLLFVSNLRVAFCSERSIKVTSPNGKQLRVHYKVMIPLRKIKRTTESDNLKIPTQKHLQLVTEDNYDFWFMGFLNHRRTLKYIQEAIYQFR